MHKIREFQNRRKKLSRFRILRSIFSSLILTTAVVAIVVFTVPNSAIGKIEKVNVFSDKAVYTVNVTDGDDSIIEGTLKLELDWQFNSENREIDLGKNIGIFDNLDPNTEYTLKIMADKGYGLEILDSQAFTTADDSQGAITGITLLSSPDDYQLDYEIGYLLSDTLQFKQINLLYATRFDDGEDFVNYQSLILDPDANNVQISQIENYNVEVNVILEGITFSGESVELDNQTFSTPFQIFGYLDLDQVTNTSAAFYVYIENTIAADAKYELVLYKNDREMRKQPIVFDSDQDSEEHQMHNNIVTVTLLYPNSDYHAELVAKYNDPNTGISMQQILAEVDFTTLSKITHTITVTENPDYYDVEISVDDSKDVYDQAYYYIYDQSGEYDYIYDNAYFDYEVIDGSKYFNFQINKPDLADYRIEIGISSNTNYFYYQILQTIDVQ